MSIQDNYWNQPFRADVRKVEHSILHGEALDDLEGPMGDFLAHFRAKMTDGQLLSRADVKPEELKPYLVDMGILELVRDEQGSFSDLITRLIGSSIEHFYGNMTGHCLSEYPNKKAVARALGSVAKAIELRAPVLADMRGRLPDGNDISVRSLYIPLSQDGETIDQIIVYLELKKGRLE